jgi:hypothetical protein
MQYSLLLRSNSTSRLLHPAGLLGVVCIIPRTEKSVIYLEPVASALFSFGLGIIRYGRMNGSLPRVKRSRIKLRFVRKTLLSCHRELHFAAKVSYIHKLVEHRIVNGCSLSPLYTLQSYQSVVNWAT